MTIDRDLLTPYQIAVLVSAAYAVHGVLHDHDESQSEEFASAMGICGKPEPDVVVADSMLGLIERGMLFHE